MKISRYKWWILGVVLITVIVLLTVVAAPSSNQLLAGSTFNQNPNGYGAWYQYMREQKIPIERWQKPFSELESSQNNLSYLKILPPLIRGDNTLSTAESNWIERGNTMVILGIEAPATTAPFTTIQSYDNLKIKIATTRREELNRNSLLQDEYGTIVWQKNIGEGKLIYAVTPYIAANAYQSFPGNYQFLAELVNQNSLILVDEYLHGFRDYQEIIESERQQTLLDYFSQTIWFPILVQIIIIMVIAIAFLSRRFGQPNLISEIQIDNSQVYIQALAAVLEKAECNDFVIETITRDEKLQLQQTLGLGKGKITDEILISAWQQATKKDATQLKNLLQVSHRKSHLNEASLGNWLQQWQKYH
ncbi:MAG TPA: DUF4350 domain-containing protein [Xenococcaceae cyanobacterium]